MKRDITVIGIDIAKRVLHVIGMDPVLLKNAAGATQLKYLREVETSNEGPTIVMRDDDTTPWIGSPGGLSIFGPWCILNR